MSARRAVWEVARRELVERSRSRVMRISVVLLLLLSVGGAIASARLTSGTPSDDVGLVGARSAAMGPAIQLQARAAGRRARLHDLASTTAASQALRGGNLDVVLLDGTRLLVKSSRSTAAVRVVQDAVAAQSVLDRLRGSGLTESQALELLTPRPLPIDVLEPNTRNIDRNRGLIVVGVLALFMVLIFYGQALAQGVTEEKSSRVVELLLTSVTPRSLLAGKVLGIGVLGLAQLVLAGGAALLAGALAGGAGLPSAAPGAVALVVMWFVLGYAFYSVAFAAVGALVSRQEDLQTAIMPITLLMTGGFYVALIVVNTDPNGTAAQIVAFVPPLSPMVVPARMVLGNMNTIELALAVALDLLATAGMIALAARVYERAILRTGAPIKLRRLVTLRARHSELTAPGETHRGHAAFVDLVVQWSAVALVIAGVLIGLSDPVAIALLALGLALIGLRQSRKHWPRRPAH